MTGSIAARIPNYYIAWSLVLLAALFMHNLVDSRAGRALRSIHGNEEAAAAMGVDTARYKLSLFVISAVFASVAGVFLTHFNGGIGPSEASIIEIGALRGHCRGRRHGKFVGGYRWQAWR